MTNPTPTNSTLRELAEAVIERAAKRGAMSPAEEVAFDFGLDDVSEAWDDAANPARILNLLDERDKLAAERDAAYEALELICKSTFGLQNIIDDHGHDANAYNYHAMKYWSGEVNRLRSIARRARKAAAFIQSKDGE